MKKLLFFIFMFILQIPAILTAQVLEQDSLALVALYNSTNGDNWTNHTNWFTGNVSTWYGITIAGDRVTQINLGNNNLTGTLPAEIGDLTQLVLVRIGNNKLSGSIPPQIGNWTNLRLFQFYNNQFSGQIPAEIGNLAELTTLQLSNNQLSSPIPSEIGNLTNLQSLELFGNPFTGTFPLAICNLVNLQWLEFYNTSISGSLPAEIGNLTSLRYVNLGQNDLSGTLPAEIGKLDSLLAFHISNNNFTGAIPAEIGDMEKLRYIYFGTNQFAGPIPVEISSLENLEQLNISNNQLSGAIPLEICTMTKLTDISLQENELTGSIPEDIGNLTSLIGLFLSGNQLSGTVPSSIGGLSEIKWIYLYGNELAGAIPSELVNLSKLQELRIHDNQFSGLPGLSSLTNLSALTVENNLLTFEDLESNIGISGFTFSPQDSVGVQTDTILSLGEYLQISVTVGGTANQYQWMKDETDVSGATDSVYIIPAAGISDAGSYICKVTNTIVTGLTLYSRPVEIAVNDPSGITNVAPALPRDFYLYQNYPNPFNPRTRIKFALPEAATVTVSIYNLQGGKVTDLLNEKLPAGYHEIPFTAGHLSSGTYFYTIRTGNFSGAKKMLLIR